MTLFSKLSILKWVPFNFVTCQRNPLFLEGLFLCTGISNPRFYGSKTVVQAKTFGGVDNTKIKISDCARKKAEFALLDYLHLTRGLRFSDAENMGKNAPHFLGKLLEKVDIEEGDIGRSIPRLLRYHPINEFEPFFESLGLEPWEICPLLPRGLIFLSDDHLMLENYQVLCDYGIARNRIGTIYKKAMEVFRYDHGVLASKLRPYEELGLGRSFVAKLIACSPYLLTGHGHGDFLKALEILKGVGIEVAWIEEHLVENSLCNWSQILSVLNLFVSNGCNNEQLGWLIHQHPGILFEGSGKAALSLIGFLLKLGSTRSQICSMFLQLPQMPVGEFVLNLRRCFVFLLEIDMEVDAVGKIFCSHALLLGSYKLKKANSILSCLNVGKKRLCRFILENPQEMKNWVLGVKVKPLPESGEEERSRMLKIKFLLDVGYQENSPEMEKALKCFRGKGADLQERFDCIVKAGLSRDDVCGMVKVSPQILNQKKHVLEEKINALVEDLGYPVSSLVDFPSFLCYTPERVKLRLLMYNWLTNQGAAEPRLSLSTVIACSDKIYIKRYVKHHPRGPEVWEDLKKRIYSK